MLHLRAVLGRSMGCRAGGGKIELVRPLAIMLKLLLYTCANERGAVAQCTLRSAKHEHSRGSRACPHRKFLKIRHSDMQF